VGTGTSLSGAELYIPDNKELSAKLPEQKNDIEKDLGEKAEWMELPGKKASRIRIVMQGHF
jgi:Domain of unknown function (DUF4268)